jgi:hypothetical protein
MTFKHIASALILAAAALAACSGGGGGGGANPAPIAMASAAPQATRTPGVAGPQNGTRGNVTLTIGATANGTSSAARRASFVSPNSSSLALTINGSAGMYDISSQSTYCTLYNGGPERTCTLPVGVAPGTTSINVSVSIYQGAGGTGALLGGGSGTDFRASFTAPMNRARST